MLEHRKRAGVALRCVASHSIAALLYLDMYIHTNFVVCSVFVIDRSGLCMSRKHTVVSAAAQCMFFFFFTIRFFFFS